MDYKTLAETDTRKLIRRKGRLGIMDKITGQIQYGSVDEIRSLWLMPQTHTDQ